MKKILCQVEPNRGFYVKNILRLQKKLKYSFLLMLIISPLLFTTNCKAETFPDKGNFSIIEREINVSNNLTLLNIQDFENEWILLKDTANIMFSYRVAVCNDKVVVMLKVKNSNLVQQKLQWSLWWSEMEPLTINAKEEKIGSCDSETYLIYQIPVGTQINSSGPPIKILSIN